MQQRVAILGLGLMGGSLGLALRTRHRAEFDVVGWTRRSEVRRRAVAAGCVREAFETPVAAVSGADVVVLCVPILSMADVLRSCVEALSAGCIVTDVGSTKAELMRTLPVLLKGKCRGFCGSHPIAGSEQQGIEAARADLYDHATVVVTPPSNDGDMAQRVTYLWECVGARVRIMDAEEHDRIMARTSHLPHLVAAVLSATVGRNDGDHEVATLCGPGFRDTTRIADGAPEIWRDIIASNRRHIESEVEIFGQMLERLREALRKGNMDTVTDFLAEAREKRRRIMALWHNQVQKGSE